MRTIYRTALATGGVLLLSLVAAPLVSARNGDDDAQTVSTTNVTAAPEDNPTHQVGDDNPGAGDGGIDSGAQKQREQASDARQRVDEARQKVEDVKRGVEQRKQDAQTKSSAKLSATKLRACERRESSIGAIMGRIDKRGGNHIELISRVAERVEVFYEEKGLSLDNYDELKAAADEAKVAAQSASDAVNAAKSDFACDGTDPNGTATDFKNLVQARNDAIRAYRDAVKELIKAVKTAAQAKTPAPKDNGGAQ